MATELGIWSELFCCPWASGATRHKVRPVSGKHQRAGKGTCLLCSGLQELCADSRSSVLRKRQDLTCIPEVHQVHPQAPVQTPFCWENLLLRRHAPFCFGKAAQVPAAALKPPGAHHPLSSMTPVRQCRQGESQAGRRGTDRHHRQGLGRAHPTAAAFSVECERVQRH